MKPGREQVQRNAAGEENIGEKTNPQKVLCFILRNVDFTIGVRKSKF